MKKKLLSILLCVLLCGTIIFPMACNGCEPDVDIIDDLSGNVLKLDYSTGFDAAGNYNSKLYSLNQTDTIGGDPGAIYVPKERSAEYGGYYYVYSTSSTKQLFGWDSDNNLYGYEDKKGDEAVSTCSSSFKASPCLQLK